MDTTLEEVISSPNWRLCSVLVEKKLFVFRYMERDEITKENYIDLAFRDQIKGKHLTVPFSDILQSMGALPNPTRHLVIHTAFCGSTLMARLLDLPSKTISIREPNALLDLAELKRSNPGFASVSPMWKKLVNVTSRLVCKPFIEDEQVILKLSNTMNNMIADLLQDQPSSKILIMSTHPVRFLVSNYKKQGYQKFASVVFSLLEKDGIQAVRFPDFALDSPNDPAPLLSIWLMQRQQIYAQLAEAGALSNASFLSFEQFLADKERLFSEIVTHLNLNFTPEEITEILESEVARTHSKEQREFDGTRSEQSEEADIMTNFSAELKQTEKRLADLQNGLDNPFANLQSFK